MALLNFKHGLLSNMKTDSPAINPGTVYITRDERAMYIDLPPYEKDGVVEAAKRVRIGDLHTFEYLDEMREAIKNDMTELTTSALYYAEKNSRSDPEGTPPINALLKWNGTDFIRLNEISNITGNLNDLNTAVASLNTRVENVEKAINDENGAVATKIGVETQARTEADAKHTEDIAKNAMTDIALAGRQAMTKVKAELAEAVIMKTTGAAVKAATADSAFVKDMLLAMANNWTSSTVNPACAAIPLPAQQRTLPPKQVQ